MATFLFGHGRDLSFLSAPVFPAVNSISLWGNIGWTTPGAVRTGRTVGDHSHSAWTSGTSQAEIMHLRTNHSSIMRHHSCSPPPRPALFNRPRQSTTVPRRPLPSPAVHYLSHPIRLKDSRPPRRTRDRGPAPSKALGSHPGLLGTLV